MPRLRTLSIRGAPRNRSTRPGKGVSNPRARKTAAEAAEEARDDASASDIAAAAKNALRPLLAEHQHKAKIRDASKDLALPNATNLEDEEARAAVAQALAGLPVGVDDRTIDRTKQVGLAPIRDRIARRVEAREHENAKERLIAIGINEI
jgi:hypothetical protein